MIKRMLAFFAGLAAGVLVPTAGWAATNVQPSERVRQWVNIRAQPGIGAAVIGRLRPGEALELIEIGPGWYAIRLADGRTGYVSRAWTVRIGEAAAAIAQPYKLHMIDVGTGLALFLEGPGFNLLYDAGSNDDTARGSANRVTAYLRHARPDLSRIDHVILSHPHKDHVELMPDVLATYQIGNVWDSGRVNPICSYRAFLRNIRDRGIAYHDADGDTGPHQVSLNAKTCYGNPEPAEVVVIPHASHITELSPIVLGNGATMTFLHADATEQESFNENSLVVAVDLGNTRVLFMGDAEAGGRKSPMTAPAPSSIEGELLACCSERLRSDVLVAGHHGSKTSSRTAFLDAASAYVFLVSAGPTRYATVVLPDQEVIDQFEERGTVYRTDTNDNACKVNPAKIGPDADDNPGGCDNLVLTIDGIGGINANWDRSGD